MFLNKYTLSLRTQVTLYFAILFVGTAAATIIFVGHNLYQLLIRRVDQRLDELVQRCQTDYIVGKNARHLGIEFPVYDLQTDLLTAFDSHLPGFAALAAFEPAQSDPYSSPTVFGYVDNKIYLMRRSSTGQIYSRELNPQPNVHLVRRRLQLGQKLIIPGASTTAVDSASQYADSKPVSTTPAATTSAVVSSDNTANGSAADASGSDLAAQLEQAAPTAAGDSSAAASAGTDNVVSHVVLEKEISLEDFAAKQKTTVEELRRINKKELPAVLKQNDLIDVPFAN